MKRAVGEALAYLERAACRARRGKGGVQRVRGRVAAAFRHRTSRAGDPQLHTHVVVGNLTEGPDGRWTALDGRLFYKHAKTAGYLYQAALRAQLTERLGVRWTDVDRGSTDIVGIPRNVIEHFSQRRAEIVGPDEKARRAFGAGRPDRHAGDPPSQGVRRVGRPAP